MKGLHLDRTLPWLVLLCVGGMVASVGAATFHPATAYVQGGDASPFFSGGSAVFVEDFEDNAIDPFITQATGKILPPNFIVEAGNLTDSVDGDDGSVDGAGTGGRSFYNGGRSILISFAEPVERAGLVWTDADPSSSGVMLEAFDASGLSLGVFDYGSLASAGVGGETNEDRFIGATDPAGIASLLVTNLPGGLGIEIDHIQWQAVSTPEPSAIVYAFLALIGLGLLRRYHGS